VSPTPLARNAYSYAPFIAKSKAACGLCFHQLGRHVELPWLINYTLKSIESIEGLSAEVESIDRANVESLDNINSKSIFGSGADSTEHGEQ